MKNQGEIKKAIRDYMNHYSHERIKLKQKGLSPVQYRTQSLITQ